MKNGNSCCDKPDICISEIYDIEEYFKNEFKTYCSTYKYFKITYNGCSRPTKKDEENNNNFGFELSKDFKIYIDEFYDHYIKIDCIENKFKKQACLNCNTSFDEYDKLIDFFKKITKELVVKVKRIKKVNKICLDARK